MYGEYLFILLFSEKEKFNKRDFSGLGKYLDEDDNASNDHSVHDMVHSWYLKILNNERHKYFLSKPQKSGSLYGGLTDFEKLAKEILFFSL